MPATLTMPTAAHLLRENPESYVTAPGGGLDFGEIPEHVAQAIGRPAGPIRLRVGDSKSGLLHIVKQRGSQIQDNGFEDAVDLVAHVAQNYTEIRSGGRQLLLVAVRPKDRPSPSAYVRMVYEEGAYVVTSALIARRDYTDNKTLLWARAQSSRRQNPGATPLGVTEVTVPAPSAGPRRNALVEARASRDISPEALGPRSENGLRENPSAVSGQRRDERSMKERVGESAAELGRRVAAGADEQAAAEILDELVEVARAAGLTERAAVRSYNAGFNPLWTGMGVRQLQNRWKRRSESSLFDASSCSATTCNERLRSNQSL